MLLKEKSALITGAGSGVGRAAAHLFAREGANVVCADIRVDWANKTVAEITMCGGSAVAQRCDVTIENDIVAAVACVSDRYDRLDIMFNNAGISTRPDDSAAWTQKVLLEEHTNDDWETIVAVNLRSVFWGCKHSIARFKSQGGSGVIVNTSSVAGLVAWGGAAYGATKAAINQLTKVVAIEGAPFDIRANAICPGGMPGTNFNIANATSGSQGLGPERVKEVAAMHPLGRAITAEDCAAAAAFLCSDEARNLTGVILPIDGGYTAR